MAELLNFRLLMIRIMPFCTGNGNDEEYRKEAPVA